MYESTRLSPSSPARSDSSVALDISDFTYCANPGRSEQYVAEASDFGFNLLPCSFWTILNPDDMVRRSRELYVAEGVVRDRDGQIIKHIYRSRTFGTPEIVIFND